MSLAVCVPPSMRSCYCWIVLCVQLINKQTGEFDALDLRLMDIFLSIAGPVLQVILHAICVLCVVCCVYEIHCVYTVRCTLYTVQCVLFSHTIHPLNRSCVPSTVQR